MTDPQRPEPGWQASARRLVESSAFGNLIVAVILLNAVTIGVQTYAIPGWLNTGVEWVDRLFLAVFVVELVLRFAADGFRPDRFFRSGWNIFDFLVVAAAFVPGLSANSTVLRLVRLLRVARLLKLMPDVGVLLDGMRRAAGPAFSLVALTALLCYLYAILGVVLFGRRAPEYFGDAGEALLTLFTLLTLEGWNSVMYDLRAVSAAAIPFTLSFILIGTYIVINLVVGVVITSLDEAYKTRASEEASRHDLTQTIHDLRASLDQLETKLEQGGMLDGPRSGGGSSTHRGRGAPAPGRAAVTRAHADPTTAPPVTSCSSHIATDRRSSPIGPRAGWLMAALR
jgi:voltage-gated sodium channel